MGFYVKLKRNRLVDDALGLGLSGYDLSGKSTTQLQAMIEARKAQIAAFDAEEKAWAKARSLDTQKAYIDYASQFIIGAHFDLAQKLVTQRMKEELAKVIAKVEKTKTAKQKAEEEFNFDEEDSTDSVSNFRNTMANLKDKANESSSYSKDTGTEDVFDQGVADQKQYNDAVAYVEKTKRETAEIWRQINEKRKKRALKKAKSRQFWKDFSTAMGQAVNEHNKQQQTYTPNPGASSSYDTDTDSSPSFDTLELENGGSSTSDNTPAIDAYQQNTQSTFSEQTACGCYGDGFDEWESNNRFWGEDYKPSTLLQCRSMSYKNGDEDENNYSDFWEKGWSYSKSAYYYGNSNTQSGWAVGNTGKRSKPSCSVILNDVRH